VGHEVIPREDPVQNLLSWFIALTTVLLLSWYATYSKESMAFKVFLSYSIDPEEQAIVWRLQTLAAAHGIEVFVPQRPGFALP
jgi:hypothetical protein